MKRRIYFLALMSLSLLTSVTSISGKAQEVDGKISGAPPKFTGAIKVAWNDFNNRLAMRPPSDWTYEKYFANIENYSIGISDSEKYYFIAFVIKQPKQDPVIGGGGVYRISKKNNHIIEFQGNK